MGAFAALIGSTRVIQFAPYAIDSRSHDLYTARFGEILAPLGVSVVGLHTASEPKKVVEDAEVLFIGGGNSFRLLAALWRLDLIETVRRRAQTGELRFIGSSAGTNMACPSLRTTNDMPIVQPPTFEAIGLVPFQVNPHYQDPDPASTHRGETREQRIAEFLEENDVAVVGLREGCWLRRTGATMTLDGITGARVFRRGHAPCEYQPGDNLSWLLDIVPRFDTPA
jgi:dipeptidase E